MATALVLFLMKKAILLVSNKNIKNFKKKGLTNGQLSAIISI